MTKPEWLSLEHVWLPYTQMKTSALPVPVVSASGVRLKLADGRELIDGVASWWTACHGYGHPHLVESVRAQLEKLPHVMFGGLAHEPAYTLAKRLAALLPGDLNHVFFSESGSVAVGDPDVLACAAEISAANASSFSRLRATSATLAPHCASFNAHARPMPCDAPVTTATLPARFIFASFIIRLYEGEIITGQARAGRFPCVRQFRAGTKFAAAGEQESSSPPSSVPQSRTSIG